MDLKRRFLKELFMEGEISAETLTERMTIYKPPAINPVKVLRRQQKQNEKMRLASGMSNLNTKVRKVKKIPTAQGPDISKLPASPKPIPVNAGLDLSNEDLKCLFEMALNGEVSTQFFDEIITETTWEETKDAINLAKTVANPIGALYNKATKVAGKGAKEYFSKLQSELIDKARKLPEGSPERLKLEKNARRASWLSAAGEVKEKGLIDSLKGED